MRSGDPSGRETEGGSAVVEGREVKQKQIYICICTVCLWHCLSWSVYSSVLEFFYQLLGRGGILLSRGLGDELETLLNPRGVAFEDR